MKGKGGRKGKRARVAAILGFRKKPQGEKWGVKSSSQHCKMRVVLRLQYQNITSSLVPRPTPFFLFFGLRSV